MRTLKEIIENRMLYESYPIAFINDKKIVTKKKFDAVSKKLFLELHKIFKKYNFFSNLTDEKKIEHIFLLKFYFKIFITIKKILFN